MLREELRRRAALQQNVNVSIARLPRVLEQPAPEIFKPFGRTVAKIVQSRTQRPTPFLVPRRVTAGMTTAIANPTTDAVRATTRRAFTMRSRLQVNLMLRREAIEKLTVVRYPKVFARSLHVQHVSKAQIAKLEMMPVGLTVDRDIDHLLAGGRSLDHPDQSFTRRQRLLESDRA